MKRFKSLSPKKRTLAIAGVAVLGLTIVGTIAYNQDAMFFNNLFHLADDTVEFVETFDSPNDWQPCQEIDKTAIATNKNATPRYVRMKINEYWRTKDTTTPITDHETTDLPLTWNDSGTDKHYAVINTQNDDKWELKNDGWYYYKTTLAQNESTLSLLKSVTFNCEVNTAGEIRYSADGKAGESVPTEYSEANYHLYITFQMSDESLVSRTRLYDLVASKTNGVDTGVNFAVTSDLTVGNGNGVNTLAAHKDDDKPVYYYRGEISDNNVLFNNFCWKMVRTTGTGGVKMIYSGQPTEENGVKQCNNIGNATQLETLTEYINPSDGEDNWLGACWVGQREKTTPGIVGYMYNRRYLYICTQHKTNDGSTITIANDVDYVDGRYILKNPSTGEVGPMSSDFIASKHYFCQDGSTSCEKVLYSIEITYDSTNYKFTSKNIEFVNGGKIDDGDGPYANDIDSEAKKTVENWFGSNMTSVEDKLEDTVYCSDRTVFHQAIGSKDERVSTSNSDWAWYTSGHYVGRERIPRIDCPNKRDSFTKDETAIGNGKLRYKVGLMDINELSLAGLVYNGSASPSVYLSMPMDASGADRWPDSWTMSPVNNVVDENNVIYTGYWSQAIGGNNCASRGGCEYRVRPVISMIYDTYVAGGDGTSAKPYTLEW